MNAHREPMASVDTAWLRMESDTARMAIGVVLIFEDKLSLPRLRDVLNERLLKFERFRQCAIQEGIHAWWQDDNDFSLDHHLTELVLATPDDKKCLQDTASSIINSRLDFSRPLWHIDYIEHYGEGSALIVRIHHCIADGMSLIRLLISLTDNVADAAQGADVALASDKPTVGAGRAHHEGLWDALTHPSHLLDFAKNSLSGIAELAKVTFGATDHASPLKGALSGNKKVAWADPFALADVKRIGKKLNATVNDILVAAVAGALRQYMQRNLGNTASACIHVTIPFNLRPLDAPIEQLGNQFGLVLLPLPVHLDDPLERLKQTRADMLQLKHSYQAHVFYGLLDFFGKGPSSLEMTALDILSRKTSAVLTNVPGPRAPVYLAGAKLKQPLVWVPQAGNVGVGIAIITYNDIVQFGFVADTALIADPDEIADLFIAQFRILEMLVDKALHNEPPEVTQHG